MKQGIKNNANSFIAIITLMLLIVGLVACFSGEITTANAQEKTITISNGVYNEGVGNVGNVTEGEAQEKYNQMKNKFYDAFNKYVMPTCILVAVCMFAFAGVKLGIEIGKAEDEAKRAEVKKRMLHWAIGIVMVMITPLLVMGISEIAMGFASGVFA